MRSMTKAELKNLKMELTPTYLYDYLCEAWKSELAKSDNNEGRQS